jgi:hypothetical protein
MRLQQYLNFEDRPRWAHIADRLLAKHIPIQYGVADEKAAMNTFLQTWKATTRMNKNHTSETLRNMIKSARKYGAQLWTNHPSEKTKGQMPIWYHPASKSSVEAVANSYWSNCQRKNHNIILVEQMMNFTSHLEMHGIREVEDIPDDRRACTICAADEEKGCIDPL